MHHRFIISIDEDPNLLYISETTLDESFKASYHSHPNLEILLIAEGKGKLVTTNRNIDMKKGDVLIINSNSKHCEVSKSGCTFYAIGINKLEAFLPKNFQKKILYFSLEKDEFETLLSLYQIMMKETQKQKKDSACLLENTYQMIMKLMERNAELYFGKNEKIQGNHLVSAALNIIENYYYTHLTLKEISHRLSVSSSLLSHEFKKETGKTIIEYKLDCQIEEACNLLAITDMSMIDIAFATGFTTSSYFSEMFKKKKGISPKEYRMTALKTSLLISDND